MYSQLCNLNMKAINANFRFKLTQIDSWPVLTERELIAIFCCGDFMVDLSCSVNLVTLQHRLLVKFIACK